MADYTIIGGDQKQYGPISEGELCKWIAEGRLNAQSLVQVRGDVEWKPLSAFPEFADTLAGESATPGAPPSVATPADLQERDYELDIGGCISRGWELVKNNFWPVVGVTALIMLIMVAISQIFGLVTHPVINAMVVQHHFSPSGIFIVVLVTIASVPFNTILIAGLFKYYLKLIRGQRVTLGDAFSGFGSSLGQLILLSLVQTVLILIGCVLCVIPGIYLAVAWYFSIPLIIDKQMGFWQAMELSRKMVSKHWFLMFAFLLVYGLLSMAGLIACLIGFFVTLPIGLVALMYAYETVFSPSQTS